LSNFNPQKQGIFFNPASGKSKSRHRLGVNMIRKFSVFVLLGIFLSQLAFAQDPDLPGAAPNLQTIPAGSLIIPMDTALQINTADGINDEPENFNMTAYGLVNKLLQNNVNVLWAIRSDKVKLRGTATAGSNATTLNDTTKNFVALGVKVGDLVTNVSSNPMARKRVTAVAATSLTLANIDATAFGTGNEYVIDGYDFTATATRTRPVAAPLGAASVTFASGPFIVSNDNPAIVAKAKELLFGTNDGIPPLLPQFNANASQLAVRVYETTTDTNNVDIRYDLRHKPYAAVSDVNTAIHSAILTEAGIPGSDACSPLPAEPGFNPNACNWRTVNPADILNAGFECATIHLEPHRDEPVTGGGMGAPSIADAAIIAAVNAFVRGGGNFFAQCHAIQYFENNDSDTAPGFGNYMTTTGITEADEDGLSIYLEGAVPVLQVSGPITAQEGGSIHDPGPLQSSPPALFTDPGIAFPLLGTTADSAVHHGAMSKLPTGGLIGGNVFYLGGHNYDGGGLEELNARRMVLNSLFVPPDRPQSCQLTINASLVIQKRVINDGGGALTANDFNVTSSAGTVSFNSSTDEGGGSILYTADPINVLAGQAFTLSESDVAGYTEGTWTCTSDFNDNTGGGAYNNGSVTLQPGDVKTCTITNNDAIPLINLAKTVTSGPTYNAGTGRFTVNYQVTATNSGQGLGTYDVIDTFSPATGITLFSTAWSYGGGETETGAKGVGYPNIASGGTVVSGEQLGAGASESWNVSAQFTVDPDALTGTEDDCVQQSEVSGTGFYNAVAVSGPNDNATDNDACVNLPPPAINLAKTVFSGPTFNAGPGTYTVVYRVTASNTGQGIGSYDLVDTFSPATGITLSSATWAYSPGGETESGTKHGSYPNVPSGGTVVSNELLGPGQSETWSVTAVFTVNPGALTGTQDDCVQGQEQSGNGFYNAVAVSGPDDTSTDNDACVNLPDPAINLAKTVFSGPTFNGGTGRYTVVYRVSATNTGQGPGTYNLVDTFTPAPGITLFSTSWAYNPGGETETGTKHASYPNTVPNGATVVSNEGLASGASETWSVTAEFTVDAQNFDGSEDDCVQGQENSGDGFYNAVAVSGPNDTATDNDACVNLPPAGINLQKTVTNGPTFDSNTGRYTVVYNIAANNTGGGPGTYDVIDTFTPAAGITLFSTVWSYGGGETETGVTHANYPNTVPNGATVVEGEGLAAGASESWTVSAQFTVNPGDLTGAEDDCVQGQEQSGTGFYNFVDGNIQEDETDNDACVNLPPSDINLSKTVTGGPTFSAGTGRYTVMYSVTAQNIGQGPGTYDLTDTFSPAAGITLFSTVWSYGGGETETGTKHGSYPNVPSGATVVANEGLISGESETWNVTAEFTVNPGDLTGAEDDCVQGQEQSGTGFYNAIAVNDSNDEPEDNDACVNLPPPSINLAKSVTGGPTYNAGTGRYTVTYQVAASNTGDGPGTYTVTDTFSPAGGITLFSTVWSYGGGETETGTKHGAYPNVPNGGTVVSGEGLASGASESWNVTAEFSVNPGSFTGAEDDCVVDQEQTGTGFYNAVAVSGANDTPEDNDACANLPDPQLDLAKTIVGQPQELGPDQWQVTYLITATNTGDGPAVFDVTDDLLPGSGINPVLPPTVTYVAIDDTFASPITTPPGWPLISDNETLAGQRSESWQVVVVFNLDREDESFMDEVECADVQGDLTPGRGFYNAVRVVPGESDTTNNEACVTPRVIFLEATAYCEADAPWVDYSITHVGFNPAPTEATISWIYREGMTDTVVSGPVSGQPLSGDVLWPASDVDPASFGNPGVKEPGDEGNAWPGWTESPPGVWTFDSNTNLVPALVFKVEVNPEDEGFVFYPPALPDCNPAPPSVLTIDKQVTNVVNNNDDTFDVTYVLTVNNSGGQVETYDLVDTLDVDESLNLLSVQTPVTYVPGTDSQDGTLANPGVPQFNAGNTAIVTGEDINPGTSEGFTFTLRFELTPDDWTTEGGNCNADDDQGTGTGFANDALLYVNQELVDQDDACEPIPEPEDATLTVLKTVTNVTDNGDDTFDVSYRVQVSNAGNQTGTYDLVDTLAISGTLTPNQIVSQVAYSAGTENSQAGTLGTPVIGDFITGANIVDGETLAAGLNEAFTFTLRFELDVEAYTPESANCTLEGGEAGTGFTNNVELYVERAVVDEDDACSPIPPPQEGEARATFRVEKIFMDGNDVTEVTFRIDCNTGLILDQEKTTHVVPGEIGSPLTFEVEFVVTDFTQGVLNCTVSEDPIPTGYSPSYDCDSNTLAVCDTGDPSDLDDYFEGPCVYTGVDTTERFDEEESWQHLCVIRNYPNPVPVVISKQWQIEGTGGDYIDPYYKLKLTCDNEITTEGAYQHNNGTWSISFYNESGIADAQYTAWVIPDWDGGTNCSVYESQQDQAVEISNGCGELLAELGDGDECTIVNTVFFEGIPTLNQYGIALLALLMLGMGLVGFRRFS
jgi:hypothetical protein